MQEQNLQIESQPEQQTQTVERRSIEIGGKLKSLPFINVRIQNGSQADRVINTLDAADFPGNGMIQAQCHRIFELDDLPEETNQYTLNMEKVGYEKFSESVITLVEPCTQFFVSTFNEIIDDYENLQKIPDQLEDFLGQIRDADDKEERERLHKDFWQSLYEVDDYTPEQFQTMDVGKLITWNRDMQVEEGEADLVLAPSPFLTADNASELVDIAVEVNGDTRELLPNETVADRFHLDAEVFSDKSVLDTILGYISENVAQKIGAQIVVFKIEDAKDITDREHGQSTLQNFCYFIKMLKTIKENSRADLVYGLLNNEALGYTLLRAGFDFYTYEQGARYYYSNVDPTKYRSSTHPESFSREDFDGVDSLKREFGEVPLKFDPEQEFCDKELDKDKIGQSEWSNAVRRHEINMWNTKTAQLIERGNGNSWDEITKTCYASLTPLIREMCQDDAILNIG